MIRHLAVIASHLDRRGQPDLADRMDSMTRTASIGDRFVRLASQLDARGQYDLADRLDSMTRLAQRPAIQPMFQKLDPAELANLYQLELRYSELAQRAGPGDEGGEDWPSRAREALGNEVDRIGDRLYELCRCVNISNEFNIGSRAHCPDCMGPRAGDYYESEDDYYDDDGSSAPSMEEDEEDQDYYTCQECGNRLHLEDLNEYFPTGGTEYGQGHIAHFMSSWRSLRQVPNAMPQKIIAIHYIINAIHGSGPMSSMFFSGRTVDIRRQLDQLSGRVAHGSPRFVRLAQRQYLLPLEMRPGVSDEDYSNETRDLIPADEIPPEMYGDDRGLYHVTTDLPAVLQHGLQSRRQLQRRKLNQQGLGGEIGGENQEMVATTYSENRADMIERDLRQNAGWIRGTVPSERALPAWLGRLEEALGDRGWDDTEDDDPMGPQANWQDAIDNLIWIANENGIRVHDLRESLMDFRPGSAEELGRRLDDGNLPPRARFQMMKDLEGDIIKTTQDEDEPMSSSGLAADYDVFSRIDPERIGTVPLQARRDAPRQHYPQEEQVNYYPSDLRILHPELLPHEGRALQETMLDPRRHRA